MNAQWNGPGSPYTVLFDEDDREGRPLPAGIEAIYGAWRLPAFESRPYIYSNFVMSQDGRVSFNVPGAAGGASVSRGNAHDQWLMGLLRARADAIIMGDNTLRVEPEHIWTAEAIFPADAAAFAALRAAEGRSPLPLVIFASYDGNIQAEAAIFTRTDMHIVIVSTSDGCTRARARLAQAAARVEFVPAGESSVDLHWLAPRLYTHHGVRSLLCEGGPTLFGSMLAAGLVDDLFLTHSPVAIGNPRGGPLRPGLVEGVAFDPAAPPCSTLLSVRRAGNYLFVRSRYR